MLGLDRQWGHLGRPSSLGQHQPRGVHPSRPPVLPKPVRYKKYTVFNYFHLFDKSYALYLIFLANLYFYTPFQLVRPAPPRHIFSWATDGRRQARVASSLLDHYWMELDVLATEGRHQGRHWAACSWTAGLETAIKGATRGWTLPKWTTLVNFFSGPRRQGIFFFLAQGDRVFFFPVPRRQGFFFFWPKETGLFFSGPRRQGFFFFFFFTWTRIRLCLRNLPFVVQEVQTPLHHARQALQVGYIGHCLTGP